MSINSVIVTGNLTRDPELKHTQSGTAVLQFSVAVNDRTKNNQGEWVDRPNFFDCTMFGTRADSLSRFLHKGSKVAIQGKLHWSSWEQDGKKRSKVEIYPDNVELLSPKKDSQPMSAASVVEDTFGVQAQPVYDTPSIYDEDIPF